MGIDQGGCWSRDEGLALAAAVVLDPRLAEVWQLVWAQTIDEDAFVPFEALGGLLRLAYLQGYSDGTAEIEPGELFSELGVRVPARVSSRPASGSRRRRGRGRPGSSGT